MMNCLEAKSKPANFQQILLFLALVHLANVPPVLFTENAVVPGKQGWTLKGSEGGLPQPVTVSGVLAGVNEELDFTCSSIISILNELLL